MFTTNPTIGKLGNISPIGIGIGQKNNYLIKIITESETIQEYRFRTLFMLHIISEQIYLLENVLKRSVFVRLVNETVALYESLRHRETLIRIWNSTVQISESALRITGLSRIINSTVQISEIAVKKLFSGLNKIITESINLNDLTTYKLYVGLKKFINETVNISEIPSYVKTAVTTLVAIITESVEIHSSVGRVFAQTLESLSIYLYLLPERVKTSLISGRITTSSIERIKNFIISARDKIFNTDR